MRVALQLCIIALLLMGCGGSAAAPDVVGALTSAGAQNIKEEALADGVPVPRSYQKRHVFEVASVAPKGGQAFTCDTKKNCDAIFAYFDAMKALAGPYTYQSAGGTVVV